MALKFKKTIRNNDPIWKQNVNMTVPFFLMASYRYYIHNDPMITDGEFDDLCKILLDNWNTIEHYHKHLIDKDTLEAGTGFYLSEDDFPSIVKDAAYVFDKPTKER